MSTTPAVSHARRCGHPVLIQVPALFLMEMSNWRWSWRAMLFGGTLTPLFSLLALGVFARDSGERALIYVMTGNIVVGLLFGTMDSIQGRVLWLRFQGGLDYVATLPVQRYAFVLAMVCSFLLFSLPSLVVTMCAGPLLFHIPLRVSPLILVVTPLCALPLAGLGGLLGLIGHSPQESGNLTRLLSLVMAGLGPVLVPPDHLPGALPALGRLSPATYAASALRQALFGPVTGQMSVDLAVLAAMAALFLWLVGRKMHWCQG